MSFRLIQLLSRKVVGSPTLRLALLTFADIEGDNGVWASVATLATRAELSKRSMQVQIAALLRRGLIAEHGRRLHENGYTRTYRISVEAVDALPDMPMSSRARARCTSALDAPVPVKRRREARDAPVPVHAVHPNLSLEPVQQPIPSHSRSRTAERSTFEEAWKAWPPRRRSDKGEALLAWRLSSASEQDKISAVRRYLVGPDGKHREARFVRNLSRWISTDLQSYLDHGSSPKSANVARTRLAYDKSLPARPADQSI